MLTRGRPPDASARGGVGRPRPRDRPRRGKPFPPDSLSRDWYLLVRTLGLPDLRLHDLRHACARDSSRPRCIRKSPVRPSDTPPTAFAMDTYSHVPVGLQNQAAHAIADELEATFGE